MLLYSYRGEKEVKEGRKEEKNGHIIILFLQTNPKSRLFQNVKEVPTIGIPKLGPITRFLEFQTYGLFLHRCRFLEFHLFRILIQFANLLNSKNRHYFQNFRFVYFQEYFLFLKWTDFWNSNSRDYLESIPISGIPEIWEFPTLLFQSIIQEWPYPKCIEQSNILLRQQGIGRVPFSLFTLLSMKLSRSAIH